jgi:hypothetical protein
MKVSDLPNPAPGTETWITSVEPWQREALLRIRDVIGIDSDALLRAGLTVVLALVGSEVPDAAPPPEIETPAADRDDKPPLTNAETTLPGVSDTPEPGSDGATT